MTATSKVIPLSPTNRARGTHEPLHALFSAAGHPLRMGILRVLKAESFSVSELCDLFSMRQSALSHHLKILADANLLSRRREGTATFYRRQLPEGQHENLRQTMFDDIDQEPLGHDLVLGRQRVQCQREQHSATFFREHGEQFKRHQESIASWEDYSRATLHLLDRAGNFRDNKILEVGFNIRVKVLEIDKEKKRISLGIKQTEPNPWENILNEYKKDQTIETEIKNITE